MSVMDNAYEFTSQIVSILVEKFKGKTMGSDDLNLEVMMQELWENYKLGDKKVNKDNEELINVSKKEYDTLKKYEKVIDCIKGENGGRCKISDFLPIDHIPEDVRIKLSSLSETMKKEFPIELKIPYKNDEPCNNQSLGNQIPNALEKVLTENESLDIKFEGCGAGYPDRKVSVKGITTPLLWEWKSMYSRDGKGVRVCITKFPNNCIPKYFNDCGEKYHLWVCLDYEKKDDPDTKNIIITITKLTINSISPGTILNTKFELSTTEDLIKSQIENGNIVKL